MSNLWNNLNRLLGNFSDVPIEQLRQKYKGFLMESEEIEQGFSLARDTFLLTTMRLIFFDHQGVTGKKTRVLSIPLDSIFAVTMETSGIGFDDSSITLSYIETPYYRASNVQMTTYTMEFAKNFNVQALYVIFVTIATYNQRKLNH